MCYGLMLLAGGGETEDAVDVTSMREALELYTGCQPIDLIVEGMHPAAKEIGLSRRAVIDVVEECRLRSARLYDQAAIPSDTTLIASIMKSLVVFPATDICLPSRPTATIRTHEVPEANRLIGHAIQLASSATRYDWGLVI